MSNLHYQNSIDNWELAKCHTRPNKDNWKHKFTVKGFLYLEPKEVLKKTSLLGWTRTQRTLQLYVKEGLVPKPTTKGAGRGKIADYPESTVAEFYASLEIINKERNSKGGRLTFKDMKVIRDLAINKNGHMGKSIYDCNHNEFLAEAWYLKGMIAQDRLKKMKK